MALLLLRTVIIFDREPVVTAHARGNQGNARPVSASSRLPRRGAAAPLDSRLEHRLTVRAETAGLAAMMDIDRAEPRRDVPQRSTDTDGVDGGYGHGV